MKKSVIIATCATAAVLATAGVSVAGASSTAGTASTVKTEKAAGAHPKARRAALGGLRVAAKAIGIPPAELAQELKAGKSVASVATAHQKDPQAVIDALVARATTRINQAKDAGKISPERATKALDHLTERVTQAVNAERGAKEKHAHRARRLGRAAIRSAAPTIDITPKALVQELRSGKTIAAIATAHDKEPQAVIDAIVAAGTKRINDAKAAGKLSDEQAAKQLDRLPARASTFVNEWTAKPKK